jgi:hypothetical protein
MLSAILAATAGDASKTPLPIEWWAFVRSHGVPEDIIRDLADSSYNDWLPVGPLAIVPMHDLINQNTHGIKRCIENGFLAIAGCRNFDPILLECATRKMYFGDIDALYAAHPPEDFAECVHPTPYLYEEFWTAADTQPDFPYDCGIAYERWPD